MSAGAYLAGLALLALVVVPPAYASAALIERALPGAGRAEVLLARAIFVLAVVITAAELLGTVGAMRPGWLVAACLAAAGLTALAARRAAPAPARTAAARPTAPVARPLGLPGAAAIGAAALVAFAWGSRTVEVLGRGMADPDTLWYHMPFAARFAQDGWTTRLHFAQDEPSTAFHPAAGELLHGIGIALFDGFDVASPWINLGFAALALLAAWCLGSRWRAGPAAVVAVALVLVLPIVTETQPGEAANDVIGLAFFLAAAALLASRVPGHAPLAFAGAAAGLAAATKLSLLAPVLALTLVVPAVVARGRRAGATLVWLAALGACGSFWYARNLARTGNPLPWTELGPLGLPSPEMPLTEQVSYSVLHYATDPGVWRDSFGPQIDAAFSSVWPLVLALAAAGVVLALVRPHDRLQRLLGAAAAFCAVAYLATPGGAAGPDGFPALFGLNLRFATPALALALVLLATAPVVAAPRRQAALSVGLLALVALVQAAADPWPPGWSVAVGVAMAVATAAVAAVVRTGIWRRRGAIARRAIAAAAVVAVLVAGWPAQDAYLSERYADVGPTLPPASVWARDLEDARVGVVGYLLQYPLYGLRVANHVEYIGVEGAHGAFARAPDCRTFRQVLREHRLDYVVTAPVGSVVLGPVAGGDEEPPEARWTRSLPGAREIARVPAASTSVFRLDGPVVDRGCPARRDGRRAEDGDGGH